MAAFHRAFASSSPVLVLPPQIPQPYTMNNNGTISNHDTSATGFEYPTANSPLNGPLSAGGTPKSWNQFQAQTPLSAAGRKRSRDEAGDSLIAEDGSYFPAPVSAPEPEEAWTYGEGMVLIRANGYTADAGSQTGTWKEEQVSQDEQRTLQAQLADRPILRSNKSQRLDMTATPAIPEEINLGNGLVAASSPPKIAADPLVDDFTLHLGIGWSRFSDDHDIQAAARGWAKFIENHFPVHNVQLRLKSKGLASYLVEANEGFFLFSEDLKQGRLVAVTLDRAFENLKHTPPTFDGDITLMASEATTPVATDKSHPDAPSVASMLSTTSSSVAAVEMDMDMS